jgi:hypothetical protein
MPKIKLSFVQRMELEETGRTKIWEPPKRLPDDEITFGRWRTVVRRGRSYMVLT